MVETYECWNRSDGRDDSEAFDCGDFKSAAVAWCESNWSMSCLDDDDTVDVAVRCDRTGEMRVFTMERRVEYEAFENCQAAVQLADGVGGDEP